MWSYLIWERGSFSNNIKYILLLTVLALIGCRSNAEYATLLTFVTGDSFRTAVVSKAIRADGETYYTILNNGKPVVFPNRLLPGGTDIMRTPALFRHPDNTFGLIAGNGDNSEYVYLYHTKDLFTYTNERLLRLNTQGLSVRNAFVIHDRSIAAYRVFWQTDDNSPWFETITDLERIIEVNTNVVPPARVDVGVLPEGALQASAIRRTQATERFYNSLTLFPYLLFAHESLTLKHTHCFSSINATVSANPLIFIISIALLRSVFSTHEAIFSKNGLYFLHAEVEA